MTTRILAASLFVFAVGSCASPPPPTSAITLWDAALAAADAERDIASSNIRFAYVGGIGSYAPGLTVERRVLVLYRYPHLAVGPQGCDQDEYHAERAEYARRYNQRMWRYVSKHN
jgi:hypothetical protein